jgi:ankyrin repeat protein
MIRSALFLAMAWSALAAPSLVDAVKSGDKTTATSLIKQKSGINTPEADGTTPLQWAVRNGDQDLADQLLKAGADVKAANRYGVTAIYLACLNGDSAMIEQLLKAGADANAVSTEGETALMTAARAGDPASVKVLLDHDAKVDAKESWHGETALMWAAAEKHTAVMKELIAHGADVNARSAANKWERQTTSEPREKWLPMGALTPLMFAARQACIDCEKILLDAGADKNAVDPDGISSMLLAIINGHYDAAEFLLAQGADPNLADKTGRTALYSAVDYHTPPQSNRPAPKELDSEYPSLDLVKDLLAHNANVNAQLKTQQPYRTKLDRGDDTMLTTGTTPLIRAAKAGDTEVVKLLLDKGADTKLATRNGINPLMAAAGLGTKEEDTTGRRKTEEDAIATIDLCLKAGADVNAVDSKGDTAMHGAAQKGYDKVIQFLADHGAKVDLKDKQGKTPLDAALGRTGGLGFDGTAGELHSSTAELLQKLAAAK